MDQLTLPASGLRVDAEAGEAEDTALRAVAVASAGWTDGRVSADSRRSAGGRPSPGWVDPEEGVRSAASAAHRTGGASSAADIARAGRKRIGSMNRWRRMHRGPDAGRADRAIRGSGRQRQGAGAEGFNVSRCGQRSPATSGDQAGHFNNAGLLRRCLGDESCEAKPVNAQVFDTRR
jgi:hypothetical protein